MNDIKVNSDTAELLSWISGAGKIIVDYFAANFPSTQDVPTLEVDFGTRYVRVTRRQTTSASAHAFIDRTNGDVLKPASWKAPAKHARGNIFDAQNGLGSMGQYGPAYLR